MDESDDSISDNRNDQSHDDVTHGTFGFPPIPEGLEYLLESAVHYGRKYQFDDAIQWFLENAEESELEVLAALAERARLSGDYPRFLEWSHEVDDVVDRMVDERCPYTMEISEQQRKDFLRLINPEVAKRWKEKGLQQLVEANDHSDIADRRRKMSGQLLTEANEKTHHMDVYFLFALMDACDMNFE